MTEKSTEAAKAVDAMHKDTGTPEEKLAQVTPENLQAVHHERQQAATGREAFREGGRDHGLAEPRAGGGTTHNLINIRGLGITLAGVMLARMAWTLWRKPDGRRLPARSRFKGGFGSSRQGRTGASTHLQKR